MADAIILFADNDADFLQTCSEFLEQEGYLVVPAGNPVDARRKLETAGIDLAILDLRLEDDDDERDISGLTLAKEVARSTPKLILTNFPSVDAVREALKPQMDGLPPAVEFVSKNEGTDALLLAIYKGLGPGAAWLRAVRQGLAGTDSEVEEDYNDAQRQSRTYFRVCVGVTLLGVLIVSAGVVLGYMGTLPVGVAATVAGLMTEAISYLFFRRADVANNRMDRHHEERVEGQRFRILLQACDGLSPDQERGRCRGEVITAATGRWLSTPAGLPSRRGSVAGHGEDDK